MNEQSTLNIPLQAPPAARVPQNTAAPATTQGAPDQGPSSFSQALKSANSRIENTASSGNNPANKAAEANQPAATAADASEPEAADPARQAPVSPATLALSALQSMLSQTTVTPTAQNSTAPDDTTPDDTTLALAAQQAVAFTQAPTANIAVPAANNKEQAASTSATLPTDPLVPSKSTPDALDTKDSKELLSLATKVVTDKNAPALVAEDLKGKDLPREATTSHTSSFATELNNAQMAFGVKPETRADSPQIITQHTISTPVTAHNWADEVGQRLSWVANKDNGRAELILNPPHMGKIEVSINLNGDQASASFTAANQATRDAIQDAMPRLREVLADAGIQLGQANVSAGNSGQAQADQYAARNSSQSQRWLTGGSADVDGLPSLADTHGRTTRGNGLVDLFA
ncbi:flagellar hook-length control protein FliK [Uliginosibacterium gangwonense]|uniref:flagellar hook-length control protein FliK n=1 Tax=Uliginosibacterium gangwonense TaxID=392736 RepID=UPI000382657D|nr:flagellar hook-length control protein FliK [Uliginosibacterium gangwonense]